MIMAKRAWQSPFWISVTILQDDQIILITMMMMTKPHIVSIYFICAKDVANIFPLFLWNVNCQAGRNFHQFSLFWRELLKTTWDIWKIIGDEDLSDLDDHHNHISIIMIGSLMMIIMIMIMIMIMMIIFCWPGAEVIEHIGAFYSTHKCHNSSQVHILNILLQHMTHHKV